jgi:hypothetical protein
MSRLARFAVLVASATACAAGAGDPDRPATTISDDGSTGADAGTTGNVSGSADDGPMACVPGQQIACPCPGGTEGAQACNADGTGYDICVCPGSESESGTTATSGEPTDDTGASTTGITEDCAADQACQACVQCAITTSCKEAYSACGDDPVCLQAENCVLMCGFTSACAAKCSPPDDQLGTVLFEAVVECVMMICPQCEAD